MPTLQQRYQRDGFLLFPDFVDAAAISSVRQRAQEIVTAFTPQDHPSIFSTDRQKHAVDAYFMASANDVRCFFEEHAFDAEGRLTREKALAINKIGHALHHLDPVFEAFSRTGALAEIATAIGLQQPQIWQSMYIFKQPGIGGEVGWHQDATFFDSEPITVTTFWFALEDASLENGCLWLEPGGHRGPLRERFVRHGDSAQLEKLDATPWPDQQHAIPLEVKAGTLVVFHGLLPHYSAPNRSPHSRHAYTLHVVDGASRYSARNWIQRDTAPRGFV
ncbi:MAG: phytanoyl-CoA dioxygenase family protein [Burkholderiales bacterium]|nr:phytanoyl-CoA dioxygenase family protein [Burkholderiales bacterium]